MTGNSGILDSNTTIFRDLLILRELAEWDDVEPRLMQNLVPVVVFCLSILFNFVLMLMSFTKKRRSFHYK